MPLEVETVETLEAAALHLPPRRARRTYRVTDHQPRRWSESRGSLGCRGRAASGRDRQRSGFPIARSRHTCQAESSVSKWTPTWL